MHPTPPAEPATPLDEAAAPGSDTERSSRRALLAAAAAGVATLAAAPATAAAQRAKTEVERRAGGTASAATRPPLYGRWAEGPTEPPSEWKNPELRLVRRVTMGMAYGEMDLVRAMGYERYLERQLHPADIADARADAFVSTNYPMLAMTPEQLATQNQTTVATQLQEATLYRAAFSERQLHERMVEFWTDHFNINLFDVYYLKVADDRDVIRKHALGKFGDLVWASAHSAAMLEYLDNTRNRFPRPNQNYARELMELHTLGVDGGYTQEDVAELSRSLTGWTVAGRGVFAFDPAGHDFGAKTVMGKQFPAIPTGSGALGIRDGEEMIKFLVAHPNTAKYVSRKMLRHLLRYDPSGAQVDEVAGVYQRTGGDIKAMVRTILKRDWLVAAPPKHKRPFHFVVSALRAVQPTVRSVAVFNRAATTVGQPIMAWETPDGYPDAVEYWGQNVLTRWNVASQLAAMTAGDATTDISPLLSATTAEGVVQGMDLFLFGGEMRARTRQGLVEYLRPAPTNQARVREALALALSSAGFQWY